MALPPGQLRKEHYAYEKLGSCALLAAIEPLTAGTLWVRLAQVHAQRTRKEYTAFSQALAATYPEVTKIRLIQDNLNTHTTAAFYACLPADEAFTLAQRFAFYYNDVTPSRKTVAPNHSLGHLLYSALMLWRCPQKNGC